MSALPPRVVFVVRETDFERLLARHATRQQARFFLESRGQSLAALEAAHDRYYAVLNGVRAQTPPGWRQATAPRARLDRFLFAADDVIVAVGQDGLVANVAKYLSGQLVLGVNPAPDVYDGVLMRVAPARVGATLRAAIAGDCTVEMRTMAEARLDSGERLLALNELFVGRRNHQSARYCLDVDGRGEDQSSSGVIIATGTGATGWARSIMEATSTTLALGVGEAALAYFVREPFPSIATGTSLRYGKLSGPFVRIRSQMNEDGVIFADGVEQDFLPFEWGHEVVASVADKHLRLVRN